MIDTGPLAQSIQSVWDPLPDQVAQLLSAQAQEEQASRSELDQYAAYLRQPLLVRAYILALLLPVAVTIHLLFQGVPLSEYGIGITVAAALSYYAYVRNRGSRLIKVAIAKQEGWLYGSGEDRSRWSDFALYYPEIFDKGNCDQFVSEQIWGVVAGTDFWSGTFTYSTRSAGNTSTRIGTVYAFPLPQRVATPLLLRPRSWSRDILEALVGGSFKTEWTEFNNKFIIDYNVVGAGNTSEIFETLTPPDQEAIMSLRDASGPFTLLFKGQNMLISFDRRFLPRHTNFFISMKIDPRDVQELEERINQTVAIAGTVLPSLD